ncbi:hypothetical protein CKAN_02354400 [Cinnamomum micranthum f. kanehirae]|uniref:Uncharacterized protein n=1 Tax=Cinnamomum micranthum f. kanehirae TaxID=337451 RepID=A0A3S3R295_9MAGN|nr:hypothetical protein CKAN_02354400 [Cinnamomum micranthum f. kanehirae]
MQGCGSIHSRGAAGEFQEAGVSAGSIVSFSYAFSAYNAVRYSWGTALGSTLPHLLFEMLQASSNHHFKPTIPCFSVQHGGFSHLSGSQWHFSQTQRF